MRVVLVVAALMMAAVGTPVSAQSPLQGPLAAPDSTPAPKPTKTKHHKAAKSARRAAPKSDDPSYDPNAGTPQAQPVAHASSKTLPGDPVEFGMKWNGSNDTARDTRVQNYDGSNAGTGAEVGMKLHF